MHKSVTIAQWENECIALSVLSMARVQLHAVVEYFKGIFPWPITHTLARARTHTHLEKRWTPPYRHKPIKKVNRIQSNAVRFWSGYSLALRNDGRAFQRSYLSHSWHNKGYIHVYTYTYDLRLPVLISGFCSERMSSATYLFLLWNNLEHWNFVIVLGQLAS